MEIWTRCGLDFGALLAWCTIMRLVNFQLLPCEFLVQLKYVDERFLLGWGGSPQGEFIPLRDEFGSCCRSFIIILLHITIFLSQSPSFFPSFCLPRFFLLLTWSVVLHAFVLFSMSTRMTRVPILHSVSLHPVGSSSTVLFLFGVHT